MDGDAVVMGAADRRIARVVAGVGVAIACALGGQPAWAAKTESAEPEREPVVLKVVAINPSTDKPQTVPVRIELPQEVTPADVLEKGDLSLEFDEAKSLYYVTKDSVQLAPKETKVFQVTVRDLWYVKQKELDSLRDYTNLLLKRLEPTEFVVTAKQVAGSILERLDKIQTVQNDETLGRKARIGAYRYHLLTIKDIKDDLARMEKLLTFVGGPPVPEMLEESPLKSDAPSKTTTWLVIFLIVIFLGLLGGQFFFTWHSRTQAPSDLAVMRQATFGPGKGKPSAPAQKSHLVLVRFARNANLCLEVRTWSTLMDGT